MTVITARDNSRVRHWRALGQDAALRRREKAALIEGPNLISEALEAGVGIRTVMLRQGADAHLQLAHRCGNPVVLSDKAFDSITETETPAGIVAEIELPDEDIALANIPGCVFLESIQDPGNVGAILRSAAAFKIGNAVLGPGCADVWSPKVLRAAAGAHFSMKLLDHADLASALRAFGGKVACTVPRGGTALAKADLVGRIGWLFGAEGQGVSDALAARADLRISIPMPGTAESLNVAAAAAVCFYELSRRGA
jgi:TrmH family RNA methyltransferase